MAERIEASGRRLTRLRRISIRQFLEEFRNTVEAEAVNSFWESRKNGKLRSRAEKHGQEILGVFSSAKLRSRGAAIREATSGTGFVDLVVTFSSGLIHLVELKMLKGSTQLGPQQLATYMKHKRRKEGWLVYFDARKHSKRPPVAPAITVKPGTIRTIVVDINPIAPSKIRAR